MNRSDLRILTRTQSIENIGTIRTVGNTITLVIYNREEIIKLLKKVNGLIRIKFDIYEKCCHLYNIAAIKPDYSIEPFDPYFSGLVDGIGSIVFNYTYNSIECNLEFKFNEASLNLCLDYVLPGYKPFVSIKRNRENPYITFKFQSVKGMYLLYDYFKENRLYSDTKFFRVNAIKNFLSIRDYRNSPYPSLEFKIYSSFLVN